MSVKKLRVVIGLSVALLVCLFVVVVVIMSVNGSSVKYVFIRLAFKEEQHINWIRSRLQSIKGSDGRPKYADASVQTVVDPTAESAIVLMGTQKARTFEIRIYQGNVEENRKDVQKLFGNEISDINIKTYPP